MSARRGSDLGLNPAAVGSPTVTIGNGLPGFAGRMPGDYHYETGSGRMYILTGLAGASGTDSFNRASSNIVGSNMETGGIAYVAMNGYPGIPITGNLLRFDGGAGVSGGFKVNTTASGSQDMSFDATLNGTVNGIQLALRGSSTFGFSSGTGYGVTILPTQISVGKNFPNSATATVSGSFGGANTWRVTVDSSLTAPTITVYKNSVAVLSWTDNSGTPLTGTYMGAGGGGNGTINVDYWTIDNLAISAPGTLAWVAEDPIYLWGLVPGALVVANNVLKPGLRVPGATTLRLFTVRVDTAPVGSALTVQLERFNSAGVSQGIAATVNVAAGTNVGSSAVTVACAANDFFKVNVTAVGSTTAGSDMLVSADCF